MHHEWVARLFGGVTAVLGSICGAKVEVYMFQFTDQRLQKDADGHTPYLFKKAHEAVGHKLTGYLICKVLNK